MQKSILMIVPKEDMALMAALEQAGHRCVCAESVREALDAEQDGHFDLVVVDMRCPEGCAPESISLLRTRGRCALLVLAAPGEWGALIGLLNAGATDYLPRPFEPRELAERVEVQLLRYAKLEPQGALRYRDLTLDPEGFSANLLGKPIRLTRQEFRVLELMLLSPPGRVFTKQDFFDYAWDYSYEGVDKTLNVHICNIRKKFRAVTDTPYIETVWGVGFRLV